MTDHPKISKKYQPKGLEIIYEDRDIIVVNKEHGLLTMGTDKDKVHTAYFLLNEYVKKGNPKSRERIFIVHRLDRETSGLLVFAKTEKAKSFLQENWADFNKKYIAVVYGKMFPSKGVYESYLAENSALRVYSTKDITVGKYAKTGYKTIKENQKFSLLEVELFTGRKNQIRVHLSENEHPVAGDKVYGKADKDIKRLALHSYSLTIVHPFTKKEMNFTTGIPAYFNALVK